MNVAILGCGAMGTAHAGAARRCGHAVVACCDAIAAKARALAKTHGATAGTHDLKKVLSGSVDAVVVATPTPLHRNHVLAAAKAGKQVFCEAPLAMTGKDCQRMLAAVEKAGVNLFVAQTTPFSPAFRMIDRQLKEGKIGDVGFVRTYRAAPFPEGVKKWYRDFGQSGGVVLDRLVHDFYWIEARFGAVAQVFCQNLIQGPATKMDYALVTLTLESGLIAQVIGCWARPSGSQIKVELCGKGGMVQFDSTNSPIEVRPRKDASARRVSSPVSKDETLLQWEAFTAWVEGKGAAPVDCNIAVNAIRCAEAALKSARNGKALAL